MNKLAITFAVFLLVQTGFSENLPTYWQVILSYDPTSLSLPQATPIPAMAKTPVTPGLDGAPVRITCNLEWLDAAGQVLSATVDAIPLGVRSAPAEGAPCEMHIPEVGLIVLRLKGPESSARPSALRLTQAQVHRKTGALSAIPTVFEQATVTLPIQQISAPLPKLAGPIGSTKVRDTGPDGNRMVVVVMGDGYTVADLGTGSFTNSTNSLVSAFLGRSPWDVAFGVANVYRIDVSSNQSGSDNDPFGTLKDTYFNSSFWVSGIERLLAIDGTGYARAIAAADTYVGPGVWDAIFVLVNSTKYGGSGGSIAVSSVHPSANEIILHEYGHTYAGLADEYSDPYPGYPSGDPEPNVDFDFSGPGLKWSIWVEAGTPLPTPATPTYANTVGTFEGARYQTTGIYRPWLNCLMRSLGVGFCPVCKEAHLQTLFGEVSLVDTTSPPSATTVLIGNTPTNIVITPIPLTGLTYEWKLTGIVQPENGPTLPLTAERIYATLGGPSGSLSGKVAFVSPLIRKFTVSRGINWAVRADCNGNGVADNLDLSSGVLHDVDLDGTPDECMAIFCCVDSTGNVDCSVDNGVDISDLSALIDHLYISMSPLCCVAEANVDVEGSIDISDLSRLIDYLYISFTPLTVCP
jgi:hypothetical protein